MITYLAAICLIGAGLFAFVAGLGLVRFQDLPSRMHAATKAAGAAFALVLLSVCLRMPDWEVIGKSVIALAFAFLTLPVAAHALGGRSLMRRPADKGEEG
ncbi:MAG: monovalent cation/H(+) antiporter subunit G [Verrucomicrobiota bacterium]